MKIINEEILVGTCGDPDLVDLTGEIVRLLEKSGLSRGSLTVFVVGSTAAISAFEFEPGLVQDVKALYERLIPRKTGYSHDASWGDANGFSHLRSMLQGPSLVIPFEQGKLALGTWQQVVLAEFDNRPRERRVVVQLIGE
ncbi:MAG: secondary thiamine-phosphate synthase enzyme YjbQ [Candidatus Omnitrophica bacterium]|nr:secondary thiamine-phosphate synthase enzyme YjbQ [Candidatus Omnitrophota bacterium]